MIAHRKLTTALALCLSSMATARGQDAADKAAEQDARVQQYVQALQPALWKELDFIRQVCDLKPAQRPKIKAAGEAAVKQGARSFVAPQQRSTTRIYAVQTIRDGLMKALKETLTAEEFAHYSEEAATRASALKRATVLSVVGQLDGILYLTQEQREKISAALEQNWKDEWEQWMMIHQYAGQYFPMIPDQHVVPHLNPDQQAVWRGLQKININSWGHNMRRQADDGWWDGMPEAAAKSKAKGKAKAASANP